MVESRYGYDYRDDYQSPNYCPECGHVMEYDDRQEWCEFCGYGIKAFPIFLNDEITEGDNEDDTI